MIGILLVPPTNGITFLLVVPFLVIIRWGTIFVAFVPILSVILIVRLLIILLLQLSLQLVVPLSESFNYSGKGLHLPLQCVGWVPSLLVCSGHWSCQDHTTLCPWNDNMAYHSFPQMTPTDDAQKSSMSWLSTHAPMGVPEEQKRRTNQRALVGYRPKTLRRLS